MINLFSSFDPQVSILGFSLSLNWISAISAMLFIPQLYWVAGSQVSVFVLSAISYLLAELAAVFGLLTAPGTVMIFVSVFFFIIFSNFMGLFPYVFTATSHLVFTLALSLPLWLGTILCSLIFQFKHMMGHLVPEGTPEPLMPVMVLIESVSSVIRPFTLAIRLAANMVAGHLLLTLLGSQGSLGLSLTVGVSLTVALVLLLLLECAVACIQSYVFTILSALYLNELMSAKFSKKFI